MAISDTLAPATSMFSGGLGKLASYSWVLIPIAIVISLFLIFWIVRMFKNKKTQWTHKLKVRRVLADGRLSDPIYHNMRRFPLIKKAEVFELETPLLGGYLIPELDEYSGHNEFSIILDKNNRIYTNKGEFFYPDKNSSVYVSAKHSEIDIQRQNLKADFQNINKINKRIEWATIAKYAFGAVALIVIMVVAIVGIQNWGEAQKFKAEEAQANKAAMESLKEAMNTVQSTVNVQQLQLKKMLEQMYGTSNLQPIIEQANS